MFLVRGDILVTTPRSAAAALDRGGEALVSGRDEAMFLQALKFRRLAAKPLGSVAGIDYSNGQHMSLTLYTISPG